MKKLGLALLLLAGCTQAQQAALNTKLQTIEAKYLPAGQLYCQQIHPVVGTGLLALSALNAGAALATGALEATVNAACAAVDATPVSPPKDLSTQVQVVATAAAAALATTSK